MSKTPETRRAAIGPGAHPAPSAVSTTTIVRLLVLMSAPFAFSTGAYVFAGLIAPMAADLAVSVPLVAQLQTAFAVACAIGGPVLAAATGSLDRKWLLVGVLAALTALNALSALAGAFTPLMGARIAAGLVGALTLPLASTIAVSIMGPERRATALAAVFGGTALAFLAGIPLGSVVGGWIGWRASFWLASALSASAMIAIALLVPAVAAPPRLAAGAMRSVLFWPLTGLLGVTGLAFAATFTTAGLVGPVTTRLTGAGEIGIGMVQAMVGIGAICGLALGARLAERVQRPLPWLFGATICAQLTYSMGMLTGAQGLGGAVIVGGATLTGSAALFAMSPIVQARLAAGAGPLMTVAFALNGSMIFLGQGLGTAAGGVVAATAGLAWIGAAGAALAGVGLILARRDLRPVTVFETPPAPETQRPLPKEMTP